MNSELLQDFDQPTDLHLHYQLPAQHNQPQFMICDDKLVKQNKNIQFHMLDNRPVPIGEPPAKTPSGEVLYNDFNVRNQSSSAGSLQKGFSRNIDIDSELKRINHYTDKCFQDNYKIHPNEVDASQSALAHHADKLVNTYQVKRYPLPQPCLASNQVQQFNECTYLPNISSVSTTDNEPVYYEFNNYQYVRDYPCQRLFHNQTKRTAKPNNRNNQFDINPNL